ncbi:hypothetical protein EGM51_00460 [Verrucomicrobia bacterium S94]|nr:hypothetical protein EGM51_00460 [Verrucomicrobia bacterium S94]
MNLIALIAYGGVNISMFLFHLLGKNRIYQFPFWAAAIALGWFFPQCVGGFRTADQYPGSAYATGLIFATFCTVALWAGFYSGHEKMDYSPAWLNAKFDRKRLYIAGAILCLGGFYFRYKLMSLPEEVLAMGQWSGAAVKYLFLASIFVFGFLSIWFLYLSQNRLIVAQYLLFLIPSLLMLFQAAVINGRRRAMMNLVSYLFVAPWFVRRIVLPRWLIVSGLCVGLLLVNSIGIYRSIMKNSDESFLTRLKQIVATDLTSESEEVIEKGGAEFNNYIYLRQVHVELGKFDWGIKHWNGLVFNYVPGQLIGRATKKALMLPVLNEIKLANEMYGHVFLTGTTATGYLDAFASFGWLGFIKFYAIGYLMGVLYRHAMQGLFLGQLLYVYVLSQAMHAISHGTHMILFSIWVYFFALGYPVLRWARAEAE